MLKEHVLYNQEEAKELLWQLSFISIKYSCSSGTPWNIIVNNKICGTFVFGAFAVGSLTVLLPFFFVQ